MGDNSFLKSIEKIPILGGIAKGADITTQVIDGLLFGYYGVGRELAQNDLADSPALVIAGSAHVLIAGYAFNRYVLTWVLDGNVEETLLAITGLGVTELAIGYFVNRNIHSDKQSKGRYINTGGVTSEDRKHQIDFADKTLNNERELQKKLAKEKPLAKIDPNKAPVVVDKFGDDIRVATADLTAQNRARINEHTEEFKQINSDMVRVSESVLMNTCTYPDSVTTTNKEGFFRGAFAKDTDYTACPSGYKAELSSRKHKPYGTNQWIFTQDCLGQKFDPVCYDKLKKDKIAEVGKNKIKWIA